MLEEGESDAVKAAKESEILVADPDKVLFPAIAKETQIINVGRKRDR